MPVGRRVDLRGARALLKPWSKTHLVAVVLSFVAIGVASVVGLAPTRSYGVLFVAVFAWIGLHHPPRTSLKVLPLMVPAYVIPLLDATPRLDPRAVVIVCVTCVFVAEAIASGQSRAASAQALADQSAEAFRTVAATAVSLQRLDPSAVLDAVADGVMALGYDSANLAIIDDPSDTFVLAHARGIATQLGTQRQAVSGGLIAQVRASRQPVVVDDYVTWEHAIDFYRDCGIRAMIGVPVLTGEQLTGILVASTVESRVIPMSECGPLLALAAVAGAALANVEHYQTEQRVAEEQTRVAEEQTQIALTDALTGLANRRHADEALDSVVAGSTIVLIDLDHFGAVNEQLGHAGGDEVLRAIAEHLSSGLRDDDFLARFGGEEFLLVLPRRRHDAGISVVERLAASWRMTNPATTFSAGAARHDGGDSTITLERADAALYAAKRAGRDRCVSDTSSLPDRRA